MVEGEREQRKFCRRGYMGGKRASCASRLVGASYRGKLATSGGTQRTGAWMKYVAGYTHTTYASSLPRGGWEARDPFCGLPAFAVWLSSACSGVPWLANHGRGCHHLHSSPGFEGTQVWAAVVDLLQVPCQGSVSVLLSGMFCEMVVRCPLVCEG